MLLRFGLFDLFFYFSVFFMQVLHEGFGTEKIHVQRKCDEDRSENVGKIGENGFVKLGERYAENDDRRCP